MRQAAIFVENRSVFGDLPQVGRAKTGDKSPRMRRVAQYQSKTDTRKNDDCLKDLRSFADPHRRIVAACPRSGHRFWAVSFFANDTDGRQVLPASIPPSRNKLDRATGDAQLAV
jgi:hypothetical protein